MSVRDIETQYRTILRDEIEKGWPDFLIAGTFIKFAAGLCTAPKNK